MLQARMAMSEGDREAAASLYRHVARQGPEFLPEILPEYLDALRRSGKADRLSELKGLYRDFPSSPLMSVLADAIEADEGETAAITFLVEHLSRHADLAGLERLLLLYAPKLSDNTQTHDACDAALAVLAYLRSRQPDHQCEHCGFVARRLHWQCPSCKHWGSIKPVRLESIDNGADTSADRRIP
jgi:lipopolysaccharide biosynthesis regulator YciM